MNSRNPKSKTRTTRATTYVLPPAASAELQRLIGRHGVRAVLVAVAEMQRQRADWLRAAWADDPAAREWERAAADLAATTSASTARIDAACGALPPASLCAPSATAATAATATLRIVRTTGAAQ